MPDGLTFVSVIVGFGLVILGGARLGAGSVEGLFAVSGACDQATGIQEGDAPRFVFTRPYVGIAPADDAPPCEIDELYAGPIRSLT